MNLNYSSFLERELFVDAARDLLSDDPNEGHYADGIPAKYSEYTRGLVEFFIAVAPFKIADDVVDGDELKAVVLDMIWPGHGLLAEEPFWGGN